MVIEPVTPVRDIHEKRFDKVQDIPSSNTFKQETLEKQARLIGKILDSLIYGLEKEKIQNSENHCKKAKKSHKSLERLRIIET